MTTVLLDDTVTKVVFDGRDEVTLTVTLARGKRVVRLDLDDIDRLLALREHAVDPVLDLDEFFQNVYATPVIPARLMAAAFIVAAAGLAEIVYGS